MKLTITGTRKGMSPNQRMIFSQMIQKYTIKEFHYGDCIGVDCEALFLALALANPQPIYHCYPAEVLDKWKGHTHLLRISPEFPDLQMIVHSSKPPLVRDIDMVDACTETWAFPDKPDPASGGGTWFTAMYARWTAKKKLIVIQRDGTVERFLP